jgi:ankyrin repeat protein
MIAAGTRRAAAVQALLKRGADTKPVGRVLEVMAAAALDRRAKAERNATLARLREAQGAAQVATWQPSPEQVAASLRAARVIDAKGADASALAELEAANTAEAQRLAARGGPGLDDDTPGYTDLIGKHGGLSALHLAVREGAMDAVVALLDGGADINQRTAGDNTSPMLMAAINGHYDLVMALLARGADPNLASDNGNTPLYGVINKEWAPSTRTPQPAFQLQQNNGYVQVVEALLKAGANPNARLKSNLWYHTYNRDNLRVDFAGATPFFRAAYATDVAVMKLLLAAGADKNIATIKPAARARRPRGDGAAAGGARSDTGDPSGLPPVPAGGPGLSPIHAASGSGFGQGFAGNDHRHVPDGWLPSVKYLVEELGADVNARDFAGYTPLHNAAARGDNEMIKYLVSKGADVTAVARNGMTTADMANGPVQRISPYLDTVKLLMDLGSKNSNRCVSC